MRLQLPFVIVMGEKIYYNCKIQGENMISQLYGKIVELGLSGKITLDVQGVGYEVETSLLTLCELELKRDQNIRLFIHMVVREDAMLLFGFTEQTERALFRALIKINGVGPKVALSILSHASPQELTEAVLNNNVARLTQIPGIGKKTAERLLIDIKDKIVGLDLVMNSEIKTTHANKAAQEAISGLISLGYKPQDANKIIQKLDDGNLT
jgi:Holliday junction DNA helicase RuvA